MKKNIDENLAASYGNDGISFFINDATGFGTIVPGYKANLEDEEIRYCFNVVKKGEESLWYYLDLKKLRVLRERVRRLAAEQTNEAPYKIAIEALKEVKKKIGENDFVNSQLQMYAENMKFHFLFSNTHPVCKKTNPDNTDEVLGVSLVVKYCAKYVKPVFVEITHLYGTYDKTAKWHIRDTHEKAKLTKQLTLEDFAAMLDQAISFGEAAKAYLLKQYVINRTNNIGEDEEE